MSNFKHENRFDTLPQDAKKKTKNNTNKPEQNHFSENTQDLKNLLLEHQLLERLHQYPVVNSVAEQTSDLYTLAKKLSPQAIHNGLDKVESTLVDVMSRPAPVDLTPVEKFGCRQLDKFDEALETPVGRSLQNLTSKIAKVGKVIADKTSLTTSFQNDELNISTSSDTTRSNTGFIKQFSADIDSKGLKLTLAGYFAVLIGYFLTRIENQLSLSHNPNLRPIKSRQLAKNKTRQGISSIDESAELKDDHHLQERSLNITAALVFKSAKKLDDVSKDVLSDQVKFAIGRSLVLLKETLGNIIQIFLLLLMAIPFIRNNVYFLQGFEFATDKFGEYMFIFKSALLEIERNEGEKASRISQPEKVDTIGKKSKDIIEEGNHASQKEKFNKKKNEAKI